MMKKDYVGLSEASFAFNDEAKGENLVTADERVARDEEREDEEEDGEELELGLSLGAKKVATAGKTKGGVWGDYGGGGGGCRILTAKDFPAALGSRASPMSSSSSSVSSSDGAKRVVEPDVAAGSANPPSQVVVGWPPIGAFRFNSLVNQAKESISDAEAITNKKNNHNLRTNSNNSNNNECINNKNQELKTGNLATTRFVKVNMDGDPIGRKVDLNAHQSYKTLALALEVMFHKPTTGLSCSGHSTKASKLLDGSSEFALTYEDKDGDWMLVGDVPWGMFLDTVKRLRIMRTSDASGLAPRFQSSTGGLLRRKAA